MRRSFILSVMTILPAALAACASPEVLSPQEAPTPATDPIAPEAPQTTTTSTGGSVTYPADHPSMPVMPNHGGGVLSDPVIVTVTFPNDTLVDAIEAFGDAIGELTWWSTVNGEYGVGPAKGGGHVRVPDAPPAAMSDGDVEAWLQAKITDGTLPAPTTQTIYALYFPASTTITLSGLGGGDSCQAFLGYHSAIEASFGGGHVTTQYAVVNRCGGFDQLTETASHELTEASTDPHPFTPGYAMLGDNAWTVAGGENADLCSMVSPVTEATYSLTRSWSNHNAKLGDQPCIPIPDPTSAIPYFNAGIVHDVVDAHPGDKVDVEVDCYSFGALPNAMTVTAHANSPQNLGITFDKSTCDNGDKLTMSIQVSATAKKGTSYHYSLLANLDMNTGHLWRGMVRVN